MSDLVQHFAIKTSQFLNNTIMSPTVKLYRQNAVKGNILNDHKQSFKSYPIRCSTKWISISSSPDKFLLKHKTLAYKINSRKHDHKPHLT